MKNKNMTLAVRATTAAVILGTAGQANAFDFTAGDVDASLYGFVRLATTYDFDEDIANGGRAGNFSAITTGNENTADGHFGMDATTSRVGISAMTPQDVEIVLEMDFEGSGSTDGLEPRLRHAYAEYKGVLLGRNWSNYNSFVGYLPTLDIDAVPGSAGTQSRTEQIRYTSGPFSVSLEEPLDYTDIDDPSNEMPEEDYDKTSSPAVTAKLEDSKGGVSYATGVMAKQTTYDEGSNDDSAIGYGAFVTTDVSLTDVFTVRATFNYSEGANAYVYRAGGNFGQNDAYLDDGEVETIESYGGSLGVSIDLGGGHSVHAGYGTATTDLDDAVKESSGEIDESTTDTNTMAFLNYKWTPVKDVTMGVEFANLETKTQGGEEGDANRLMYLAKYSF